MLNDGKNHLDRRNELFRQGLLLALAVVPSLLNDLFYLNLPREWVFAFYLVDYGSRILGLFILWHFFGKQALSMAPLPDPPEKRYWPFDFIMLPLLFGTLYAGASFIFQLFHPISSSYPAITQPMARFFDMTIGLMLVAYHEELLFRRHVMSFFQQLTSRLWVANLAQAALFGLIHWSMGFGHILDTMFFGFMAGFIYQRKRSLAPVMILHFYVNFLLFYVFS